MNNIGSDTGKIVCEQVDTAVRSKIRNIDKMVEGVLYDQVRDELRVNQNSKVDVRLSFHLSDKLWNATRGQVILQLNNMLKRNLKL
jgi:hypothetical protein